MHSSDNEKSGFEIRVCGYDQCLPISTTKQLTADISFLR